MDPTAASVWTLVLGAECISEPGAQVRCEQTTAGLFPSGPGCPRGDGQGARRQAGRTEAGAPARAGRAATETGRAATEMGKAPGDGQGWGAAWSAGTSQLAPFANWLHSCLSPSTL